LSPAPVRQPCHLAGGAGLPGADRRSRSCSGWRPAGGRPTPRQRGTSRVGWRGRGRGRRFL